MPPGFGGTDAATALLLRRPPEADGQAGAEGETVSPANVLAVAGAARNLVLLGDPQQLLLDRSYRMHPDLCRYTSEVFYDGKLHGVDGLGRQEILGDGPSAGSGLRVMEVAHEGSTNASPEEADAVARLAETLAGCSWRDRDDAVRPVGADGILIVTPYNAQIRAIQDALAARGLTGFRVGTVDKFQGRGPGGDLLDGHLVG